MHFFALSSSNAGLTKSRQGIYTLYSPRMKYTIRTVATMTGLSQHTIRAWERRHHINSPNRTETNRRLFDDAEVLRLQLLKSAVDAGHSIGQASELSNDELRGFVVVSQESSYEQSFGATQTSETFVHSCISHMERLDENGLRGSLARGSASLGALQYVERVVVPLIALVENRWVEKSISIAQEHMVSAVLRTNLEQLRTTIPVPTDAPRILITTPKGQLHELGALITAVIACLESWQVTYLGPNLPADEIAGAAFQRGAKVVALSLVYPVDDPDIPRELGRLRQLLGGSFPIFVGGRAARGYTAIVNDIGLLECHDLDDFRAGLLRILSTKV